MVQRAARRSQDRQFRIVAERRRRRWSGRGRPSKSNSTAPAPPSRWAAAKPATNPSTANRWRSLRSPRLSGSETHVEGRVEGTHARARQQRRQPGRNARWPWPKGALLAEGLRLASLQVPLVVRAHAYRNSRSSHRASMRSKSPARSDNSETVSLPGRRDALAPDRPGLRVCRHPGDQHGLGR